VESLFPHDENENALFAAATGKPMASTWLHCERVLKEGRPLKDAGQVTVRDLLTQGYRGEEVRYFLLATHYRKPLALSDANFKAAAMARARLDHFLERLTLVTGEAPVAPAVEERLFQLKKEFTAALDDDLNISRVLSACFAAVAAFNSDIDRGALSRADAAAILSRFQELDDVLGVMTPATPVTAADAAIEAALQAREEARQRRDWAAADQIRRDLAAQGIEITDTAGGPRWRRK
jgi:cysteinyl-tRNA synthetase